MERNKKVKLEKERANDDQGVSGMNQAGTGASVSSSSSQLLPLASNVSTVNFY